MLIARFSHGEFHLYWILLASFHRVNSEKTTMVTAGTTPEESSDSDGAALYLFANLNLQAASQQNLSLSLLQSSLFSDFEDKGYSSSLATIPTSIATSSSYKHGCNLSGADKISSDFTNASQSLLEQICMSHKENFFLKSMLNMSSIFGRLRKSLVNMVTSMNTSCSWNGSTMHMGCQ